MQRRDFLKASVITGASAALESCGNPEEKLIRFIPEEDLVPGVATWKPSICPLCRAGCGVIVRVMEGEAEVLRDGRWGLMKMGLAKKLEGNPNHPVSQGKLCPRGQAALQVTYHPDRLKGPLRRTGPRASGQFQETSWDEGLKELTAHLDALRASNQTRSLVFLSRPVRGERRELMERFLKAFGAPPLVTFELFDDVVLRHANSLSFGLAQLPTFDFARSNYVISFGADFLGTWNSPVAQSAGYGVMRQGRAGMRGKFVTVEPRLSQTGANADEWVAIRPGTEGVFALGLAHVILKEKLLPAVERSPAVEVIEGWSGGLVEYAPDEVERQTGVPAAKTARLARELATHRPAVALIGGAPLAQTNGLFGALAVNALNALLGSVGEPGGIFFTPQPPLPSAGPARQPSAPRGNGRAVLEILQPLIQGGQDPAKVLLLYDANPVFALPATFRVREALEKVPFIVSFSSFIDETSALADLILPDHSFLESWGDDVPESGTMAAVASVAPPVMLPLYNTRPMPDVLLKVVEQLCGETRKLLPWKSYEEMLQATSDHLRQQMKTPSRRDPAEFWKDVQEEGGWWDLEAKNPRHAPPGGAPQRTAKRQDPEFDGPAGEFPFNFLPFASQAFWDGSLAHLPWMQEMPDALSTVMWGSWVEINPKTAERLKIEQGDFVEVASQHGNLRAPAVISPGLAPDVIAMPVGQGHSNFGRYASGRGSNPIAILAPLQEPETGSLAWAATRVRIARVGQGKLTMFAGGLSRFPHEKESR